MFVRKRKRLCINDFIRCLKMEFWSFVTTLTGRVVCNLCNKNNVSFKQSRELSRNVKNKTVLVKL